MSKDLTNNEFVLPPNVNGKSRGFLEIALTELKWSTAAFNGIFRSNRGNKILKTPDNYVGSGGVSVKFIWWGQNHQDGAVLKVSGHSSKLERKLIHYNVHTSPRLFMNYLLNCEPIEIKLTANTSNLQLGTVFARIPTQIINACKPAGREVVHVGKFRIFSPRNIHIGSIELRFRMLFYDELQTTRSSQYSWKSSQSKCVQSAGGNLTSRSYRDFKIDNPHTEILKYCISDRPSSCQSISPKILDYLSGRDMSAREEEIALQEIRRTSPLSSVVDELLTDRAKQNDLFSSVDSLRLKVCSLTLLPAGIREVYVQSLASVSFTIECRISPNLLDKVRPKYDYDVVRFYSDTYSDKSQRINFDKEALRAVKIVRNEFCPSIVEEAHLLFTIWWRQFGSKHSRCLGTTRFEFTSLFEAAELEQTQKLVVRSCTGNVHVANLTCIISLGTKGVHFGPDFTSFFTDNIDSHSSENSSASQKFIDTTTERSVRSQNSDKDGNDTDKSGNSSPDANTEASETLTKSKEPDQVTQAVSSKTSENGQESSNLVEVAKPQEGEQYRLLQGLLYVGSFRSVKSPDDGGYFLVCRAFWKEDATSTEFALENNFNFLEIFPIINDDKFLDRARNNHLNLELWHKGSNSSEQLIGVVRLPLHQFFIAFRDSTITNHLCQAKLPVISIDGWVPITSPLSGEICGQLQSLLAIGTEEQLEYLKACRGLNFNYACRNLASAVCDVRIPVPPMSKLPVQVQQDRPVSCDVETQVNLNESPSETARRERFSDLLGTFIENLAQRLPSDRQNQENVSSGGESKPVSLQNVAQGVQIRKTSDLLDVLQKALITPPPYNLSSRRSNSDGAIMSLPLYHRNITQAKFCKILLEIESALHLPRNHPKVPNKKTSKRASASKAKQTRLSPDEEPSAYVTFQAEEGYGQMVKSHEGLVYATHVVEKSCNPTWLKRFEVAVPVDLLTNNEKRFILKIWRKTATDLAQCRLLPTPMEDSIIGFAAVDLNVLPACMPFISGWFNIVDFNGRINGQIKVNVQPLEDVLKFKENPVSKSCTVTRQGDCDLGTAAGTDFHNSTLSRALKRKFTELEEITQRLRARLFDVTGEAEREGDVDLGDADDAQLDEFERDINTAAEEDEDDDVDGRQNFGWLGCVPSNIDNLHSECSSTSGGDSQERIQLISEYLRRTDISESQQQESLGIEEACSLPEGGTEGRSNKAND